MANKVYLRGNLGKDPLLKTLQGGAVVCEFSIADRVSKDETQWHNIKAWNKTAEFADKHLAKGCEAVIWGRLSYRKYKAKDGSERSVTEIIAESIEPIDWKDKQDPQQNSGGGAAEKPQGGEQAPHIQHGAGGFDDIPF